MWIYAFRRTLSAIPVAFGVTLLTFLVFHAMPVDPARLQMGIRGDLQTQEEMREKLGLNDSLGWQYVRFLKNACCLDFGRSFSDRRLVLDTMLERMPATALLAFSALVFAVAVGIPLGIVAAIRRNTWLDFGSMLLALAGLSIPIFFLGLIAAWFFGSYLRILPPTGYITTRGWEALILPALTLGTRPMSVFARLTRSSLLEVLRRDYVLTARAKGLTEWSVILRHALRNALNPVLTALTGSLAELLVGAFFIEYVFQWPGIGKLALDAARSFDLPVIQGTVLLAAVLFVSANVVADLVYRWLDPRVEL